MKEYTREELIEICKDAIVHHTKWNNRDSYSSQVSIQQVHRGLTAGLPYRIDKDTDERTIWIHFDQPIDFQKLNTGEELQISSREDYFRDCDPEYDTEMQNGCGIDWRSTYTGTYMPTRERLIEAAGDDWY